MNLLKMSASTTLVIATTLLSGCIGGEVSESKISNIVEKTLMDKPEIIIKALEVYRTKETVKRAEKQKNALKNNGEMLKNDKHSLVLGNPDGDVTVVAFKDYRCGYCKKSWSTVKALLNEDKNIRFVFKEFPVLGPASQIASRFALASSLQGKDKYATYNNILMQHRGPWDEKTLIELGAKNNLDVTKLKEDASGKFVNDALTANRKLGTDLAISGTPAFVIGSKLIPGAVSLDYLKEEVAKLRKLNSSK